MLELRNICFERDGKKILDNVNLVIDDKKFVAIKLLENCDSGYEFVQNSFEKYQLERYDTDEEGREKG